MLWAKAFHIVAMVAWFAGLFYLPRLFVYHVESEDSISLARFQIMEWRLYYCIMWPAAIATTILGIWLVTLNWPYYKLAGWFHAKLGLVVGLWGYHWLCGHYLKLFAAGKNTKTSTFYRILNELPTVFLISIIVLVVVKPF